MKLVLLGTSEFAIKCAHALIEKSCEICAFISMPTHALPDNSANVGPFAQSHNIPYHEIENINAPDSIALIRGYSPDYLFVSWPRLLSKDILEVPRFFCIGTHPTDLPSNRGRHPLHWLIALGIQHSQLSFFEMDENVDTGKILLQVPFEIFRSDTIADAMKKMNLAGYLGTKMLYERLKKNPALVGKTQDHSQGNVWRKRTPHDVTLDLRLSTDLIIRIVRSFSPPYPCANLIYKKDIIKISDAVVAKQNIAIEDVHRLEPGNILHIEKKAITIKAANEVITLISKDELPESILSAKYIHPPSYYMQKWPEVLTAL